MVAGLSSPVFINELHYDNAGTDAGEFVEVANPTGIDLTGWVLTLYNGNGGAAYGTPVALSGTAAFTTLDFPANGIQNGAPDGLALSNSAGLVQFLSYEGAFAATDGPAAGQTSTDIGVLEDGTGTIGQSLQLTGTGAVSTAISPGLLRPPRRRARSTPAKPWPPVRRRPASSSTNSVSPPPRRAMRPTISSNCTALPAPRRPA